LTKIRSADLVTYLRTALIIVVAYLVIVKFNAFAIIILLAVAMLSDAIDGYFAVREESKGKIGFITYVRAATGNKKEWDVVHKIKQRVGESAPYGPRIDIAGDRISEYVLWVTFTFLHIVPLFVLFIIIIRHSFADALLGAKGTSSKMHSRIARSLYASNVSRAGIQITKFVTFAYLALVYVLSYPLWIGYVLIGILTAYILIRGVAEIYEALHS
jgi:phosphatidylglycerophosphate synthase